MKRIFNEIGTQNEENVFPVGFSVDGVQPNKKRKLTQMSVQHGTGNVSDTLLGGASSVNTSASFLLPPPLMALSPIFSPGVRHHEGNAYVFGKLKLPQKEMPVEQEHDNVADTMLRGAFSVSNFPSSSLPPPLSPIFGPGVHHERNECDESDVIEKVKLQTTDMSVKQEHGDVADTMLEGTLSVPNSPSFSLSPPLSPIISPGLHHEGNECDKSDVIEKSKLQTTDMSVKQEHDDVPGTMLESTLSIPNSPSFSLSPPLSPILSQGLHHERNECDESDVIEKLKLQTTDMSAEQEHVDVPGTMLEGTLSAYNSPSFSLSPPLSPILSPGSHHERNECDNSDVTKKLKPQTTDMSIEQEHGDVDDTMLEVALSVPNSPSFSPSPPLSPILSSGVYIDESNFFEKLELSTTDIQLAKEDAKAVEKRTSKKETESFEKETLKKEVKHVEKKAPEEQEKPVKEESKLVQEEFTGKQEEELSTEVKVQNCETSPAEEKTTEEKQKESATDKKK
jgi:hypothetical protein